MMTARLIREIGPETLPPPEKTKDIYIPYQSVWEADTPEEALAAARQWVWDKISGHNGSFIRHVPDVSSERDFDSKLVIHRAFARVSVCVPMNDQLCFGTLKELPVGHYGKEQEA